MKPEVQAKLLRVIQERQFERVGGSRTISVDVRWIAATNRDPAVLRASGALREDLYHRLAVFPISLPPLRERPRDIVPLAEVLLRRIAPQLGQARLELGEDAIEFVQRAGWPGNVRELANALERAAIMATGPRIHARDFEPSAGMEEAPGAGRPANSISGARPLSEVERYTIEAALAATGGNRREAAEKLGIGLRTLYDKLKRYRVDDRRP
jgi:two-component system response regulator FlrC